MVCLENNMSFLSSDSGKIVSILMYCLETWLPKVRTKPVQTRVATINKIAASSYTFYFQAFGKPFIFEMLLQNSSSLELHIG